MSFHQGSDDAAAAGTHANGLTGSRANKLFNRGKGVTKGFRLQFILFVSFVLISALPVVLLSIWDQHAALRDEYNSVNEKHLIIAENLSGVFDRYVIDVKEGFRFAVLGADNGEPNQASHQFLKSLSFCDVSIIDGANSVIRSLMESHDNKPPYPSPEVITQLRDAVGRANGDIVFSNIIQDRGKPLFFVVMALENSRIAIGSLTTDYIRKIQRQIGFGERGHSMVVDANGVVIAHPNAAWENTSKDASKLSVVGAMMRGETGVSEFYSPPMQANMIAGHTSVPGVGWGVMVPQPVEELENRANDGQKTAILITLIGIILAAIFSWWLSRFLAKPIVTIDGAAVAVASGELRTQVATLAPGSPRELQSLSAASNVMVNQLREREERLQSAKDEAVAADRAKTDFLANMSHELRTPLNAIIGFSEMIKVETFGPIGTPQYSEYVKDINNSGNHLLRVINDVLDMAKIEAGHLEPLYSQVDMTEIAETCISFFAERADKDHIELKVSIGGDLPKMSADDRMVQQIILNLLSNAIKFTPEKGVVELSIDADLQRGCVIQVRDNGIGMDPAKLDVVMQPFGQIDAKLGRKYEGTGLGLPLVKSMVDMHGGTLDIDTALARGTAVTVTLPLGRVIDDG